MVRGLVFGFAVLFAGVVAMGYVPQFIQVQTDQRLMFGLFQISLIDDITHGVTAIAALLACLTSARASLLFLTAFGYYYGLDAIFFLTYGFFNDKPYIADILLNLPHVLISTVMLSARYYFAPKFGWADASLATP
jgi:hypothetical protein